MIESVCMCLCVCEKEKVSVSVCMCLAECHGFESHPGQLLFSFEKEVVLVGVLFVMHLPYACNKRERERENTPCSSSRSHRRTKSTPAILALRRTVFLEPPHWHAQTGPLWKQLLQHLPVLLYPLLPLSLVLTHPVSPHDSLHLHRLDRHNTTNNTRVACPSSSRMYLASRSDRTVCEESWIASSTSFYGSRADFLPANLAARSWICACAGKGVAYNYVITFPVNTREKVSVSEMAGRRREGYLEPEEELGITHVRKNVCDRYIHS